MAILRLRTGWLGTFLGAFILLIAALLSACGALPEGITIEGYTFTPTMTTGPSPTPTATATATRTPTLTTTPPPTPTYTATTTPMPTPTRVEMAATTAPEVVEPVGPQLEAAIYTEEVTGEVQGVPVQLSVVTGQSLVEREWFIIERITLNSEYYPDAAARLAEIVLRAHWQGWLADDPEGRAGVAFADYLARLGQGEDLTYQVVFSSGDSGAVDPREPVILFFTGLPQGIYLAEGNSFSLWREGGKLYVVTQLVPPARVYFDRYYQEDAEAAIARYASFEVSRFDGLKLLSFSDDFLRNGATTETGLAEARRLERCGEFAAMDDLAYPCADANHEQMRFQAVIKALLREPILPQ